MPNDPHNDPQEVYPVNGGPLDGQSHPAEGRWLVGSWWTDYKLSEDAILARASCMAFGTPFPDWLNEEMGRKIQEVRYSLDTTTWTWEMTEQQ